MLNFFHKKSSSPSINPIHIEFCETLGACSGAICQLLMPYYKTHPSNPDQFIWENFGFLLGYLYEQDGIDQSEVVDLIKVFSTYFTYNKQFNGFMDMTIRRTAQFYSECYFDMNRTKKHTLPDVIVFNLTHPQSWKPFDEISIFDVNILETTQIWSQVADFLVNSAAPQINKVLEKM